jgi:hypothetical protein
MLRKIFGCKKEKGTGGWTKVQMRRIEKIT